MALLQGMNDWRNIQDIVRVTFKAFHDVLKAQGDAIRSLERALDKKASQREVATALAAKVSAEELADKLHTIDTHLARKADAAVCFAASCHALAAHACAARGASAHDPHTDVRHVVRMQQHATQRCMAMNTKKCVVLDLLQDVSKCTLKADISQLVDDAMEDTMAAVRSKASARDVQDMLQPHAERVRELEGDMTRASRLAEAARRGVEDCVTVREVREALESKVEQSDLDAAVAGKVRCARLYTCVVCRWAKLALMAACKLIRRFAEPMHLTPAPCPNTSVLNTHPTCAESQAARVDGAGRSHRHSGLAGQQGGHGLRHRDGGGPEGRAVRPGCPPVGQSRPRRPCWGPS